MEYFGNLVLWAFSKLRVRDLLDGSHAFVAKAIRDAVARIDDEYFKSFIEFGGLSRAGDEVVKMTATAPRLGDSACPDLQVESWLRFQFHDLPRGDGGQCAVLIPKLLVEGRLVFVPSCREVGGIDVVMSIWAKHKDQFKRICHSSD